MATVRCWALHGNISNAISYVLDVQGNGEKTENKYFECSSGNAYSAAYQWKVNEDENENPNKIVGFHFQQSFEPGSITPDEAYSISKKWIEEILGDEYDYVLTLHTDKIHIHSHIIVNSRNKVTGKQLNIFYYRDLPRYKNISDRICKESGLEILQNREGNSKSYYEWLMQNKGDSLKDIVAKTLDNLVERVASYDELKQYMELLGFEVEDGTEKEQSFIFTGNIKLISDELEDSYMVRLPYSQMYMYISKDDVKWIKENTTFKVSYQINQEISIYDKNGNFLKTINAGDLDMNWEKKDDRTGRQGLRIKPPGAKKFIRCNRIEKNANGLGYSLDEILERIENNSRLVCDPNIKQAIHEDMDNDKKKEEKSRFYEEADIKDKWKNTDYYKKSKKERYVEWRTQQLQNRLNRIHDMREMMGNVKNLDKMKSELHSLKKEYRNLNDDIRKQEKILENIQNERMEGMLDITDHELDDYIRENITPLYKMKKDMYQKIKEMESTIKNTEKFKESKDMER